MKTKDVRVAISWPTINTWNHYDLAHNYCHWPKFAPFLCRSTIRSNHWEKTNTSDRLYLHNNFYEFKRNVASFFMNRRLVYSYRKAKKNWWKMSVTNHAFFWVCCFVCVPFMSCFFAFNLFSKCNNITSI